MRLLALDEIATLTGQLLFTEQLWLLKEPLNVPLVQVRVWLTVEQLMPHATVAVEYATVLELCGICPPQGRLQEAQTFTEQLWLVKEPLNVPLVQERVSEAQLLPQATALVE